MPFASFAKPICFSLLVTLAFSNAADAKSPLQWVTFRRSVEENNSTTLTDTSGPWLIFASSFAGEGAEKEALQLAEELRTRYKLKTYVHSQQFDFSDTIEGIGINKNRTPKMMKYDKSGVFDEYAVMIGDFESIDDPNLQKTMKRIKYAKPATLTKNGATTTRRFAGLRDLHRRINGNETKQRKGPMGSAFATPNPKVPRELIAPRGADSFVIKMNEGVRNSLLDCNGKYSVRVATFRGNVIIDQQRVAEIVDGRGEEMKPRLMIAAEDAHELTVALRSEGVEAYEFHDRHESYVTVGSFDWVGDEQPDGTQEMNPAILSVIQKYSPSKQALPGKNGQTVHGLQPKMKGTIPFDIQPWPVEVPRRSIARDYARR